MSTVPKVISKKTEMTSLESHKKIPSKKLPTKNIFSNIQSPIIIDPIKPARISKVFFSNDLNVSSVAKAGLVFLGTVGSYYLAKTTGVFSYFGWGEKTKNPNSKDSGSSEIVEVKNRANALNIRTNLETERQVVTNPLVGQTVAAHKDRTVKFEEIKVEEFKNLREVEKEENEGMRRSISIQNLIPDQNATIGEFFELTIDGISVFSSSSALFLEATNIPLWVTSSSNPNPSFKGSYDTSGSAYEVALSGSYAYVADDSTLQIIDITDPANPIFKGSYNTPGAAWGIALSGNFAYVADASSGLQIIDITDPSNPTFKGSYDTPGYAYGVTFCGGNAVVADGDSGLQIIDRSDPTNPTLEGVWNTPSSAVGVACGGYAYVADDSSGLQIIDVYFSIPEFKGSYNTPGYAYGVALSGNYAYVADHSSGLQIIDITSPSNPTFKGSHNTPGSAYGVAISGSYAYVADYNSGLQIIDITDPADPTFKGSYNTPGEARGVALSGNYAYVADGPSGLQIIASNLDKLRLSGIPDSAGLCSVNIKACNEAKECITDSFDIMVRNNAPIVSNPIQDRVTAIGILFEYIFSDNTFFDLDGDSLTYTAKSSNDSPLPNWLDFDSPQRKFFGTPTALDTYSIKVTANDGYGSTVSDVFNIQVINNAPSVSTPLQDQETAIGILFEYIFSDNTFNDPDGHSLTYTAKSSDDSPLPNWLDFESSQRKFFGTPIALDTHSIKVTANDSYGGSIFDVFDIEVINNAPIVSSPLQNQTAIINTLFNYIFLDNTFIDPDGHFLTYTAKSSDDTSLPSWLRFSSLEKKFSGIPTTLATYPIKVTANDSYGGSVSNAFNIDVHLINKVPIVSNPLQSQTAMINALFNYIFPINTFLDLDGHSLTYTAKLSNDASLPGWLNFNSIQRNFSGTPITPATYSIKVTANDGYDGSISDTFNLIVKDSPSIDIDNILDWLLYVGIGTGTTLCVGIYLCSAIFTTIIVRKCKQEKNIKTLGKIKIDRIDDIELEEQVITDDSMRKIEEELTKKAQKMTEAAQNNQTSTVIELSKELKEGEIKHGSQLQNPGVIAVKLAQAFESDAFNILHNESKTKQKVFECFEKYFGLHLTVSVKRNQIVVADYQEKMLKLIRSFKQTVRKNYKVKFSLDAIEQAMKNLETTESKLKVVLSSAIHIQETGILFTTLVEQYKKIPGEWYPKMITNRYTAYKSRSDVNYLSALQKILVTQKDWHILIDGINSLVDIALSAAEDKIKNQALLGDKKAKIRGLSFWAAYEKGSKSSIIRMETVKGLANIIKYSEDSNLKKQAFNLILERKVKEKNENIRTFIENFEKKVKDEFKKEAKTTTKKIKKILDKKYVNLETKKLTLEQMKIYFEENIKSIEIEEKEAEKLKKRIEENRDEENQIKEKLELTNQKYNQIEKELSYLKTEKIEKELSQVDQEKEQQLRQEKDELEKIIETLESKMFILDKGHKKYEKQLETVSQLKQKQMVRQEKINNMEKSLKKKSDEYAFNVKQFEYINSDYQLALKLREEEIKLKNKELDFDEEEEFTEKIPEAFKCPITLSLLKEPYMLVETGQTYGKEAIETWLADHDTDPLTGKRINNKKITINFAIKSQVEEWIMKHKKIEK
jgi:hypothetical protein